MKEARLATRVMIKAKHTTINFVAPEQQVLYHYDSVRKKVASVLVFFKDERSDHYVAIAWVNPAYRKKGLLKGLFDALKQYSKTVGVKRITTEVSAKNNRMLDLMSRNWDATYVFFSNEIT